MTKDKGYGHAVETSKNRKEVYGSWLKSIFCVVALICHFILKDFKLTTSNSVMNS